MLTAQPLIAVLSCQASSGTLQTPSQSNLSNQNITYAQPSWNHFPFFYKVLTTEMLSRVSVWMLSFSCIDLNITDLMCALMVLYSPIVFPDCDSGSSVSEYASSGVRDFLRFQHHHTPASVCPWTHGGKWFINSRCNGFSALSWILTYGCFDKDGFRFFGIVAVSCVAHGFYPEHVFLPRLQAVDCESVEERQSNKHTSAILASLSTQQGSDPSTWCW